MTLNLNDMISWVSADGYNEGVVVDTFRGCNAKYEVGEWVLISYTNRFDKVQTISMPNNSEHLNMMKVRVI